MWTVFILVAQKDNESEEKVWNYINELGIKKEDDEIERLKNVTFHFIVDVPNR
jgi:hypothetical protein